MRLLVTGATGYLGREVLRRAGAGAVGWRGRADVDVRDEAAVRVAVARAAPGAIVHTAYVQHGDEAWAVNVDGSRHVAAAAHATGARLVHVSTDVIFSGRLRRPIAEDDEPDPVTAYGAGKAAAEEAVRAEDAGAVLVRTSLIYGGEAPSDHERLALDGSMSFYEDEWRCPVQVGDLAGALLALAARRDVSGPLHVAGGDRVNRLELARLVVAAAGGDPGSVRATRRPQDRPGDLALDCSRAARLLGATPRGVRAVLGRPRTATRTSSSPTGGGGSGPGASGSAAPGAPPPPCP